MNDIASALLLGFIRSAQRSERQHEHALSVLRTVYEQQSSRANLIFGTTGSVVVAIISVSLALVLTDITRSVGSQTNTTTTTNGSTVTSKAIQLAETGGFNGIHALVLAFVGLSVIFGLMALRANGTIHSRNREAFLRNVAHYFELHERIE